MKKGTLIPLLIAASAFLFLIGLAVWLTFSFGDAFSREGENDPAQAFTFQTEASGRLAADGTADGSLAKDSPDLSLGRTSIHDAMKQQGVVISKETALPDHRYIWVGDSRTLGMMRAVKDGCVYIGAAGEGYDWFVSQGESEMRRAIAKYPEAPVIFNLGVNDYDNMELYLKRYSSLVSELSGTDFYFLSVNPIDPAVSQVITNEQIADFNDHLREAFPDSFLDSFTYLMANEVIPIDGIHYDKETYRMLHDFVIRQLEDTE